MYLFKKLGKLAISGIQIYSSYGKYEMQNDHLDLGNLFRTGPYLFKNLTRQLIISNFERSMKNFFFGIFLGFSTRYTIVALDQIQKSNFSKNLKVLPIWNCFYFINLAIFGDFMAIFAKKS